MTSSISGDVALPMGAAMTSKSRHSLAWTLGISSAREPVNACLEEENLRGGQESGGEASVVDPPCQACCRHCCKAARWNPTSFPFTHPSVDTSSMQALNMRVVCTLSVPMLRAIPLGLRNRKWSRPGVRIRLSQVMMGWDEYETCGYTQQIDAAIGPPTSLDSSRE
jgi:hypothetical protein